MSTKSNDLKINRQLILNSGGANPEDYLTPKQLDRYKQNPERFIDIDIDLVKKRKGLTIANKSLTPKDFGPIKLYGIPHVKTKYIKDFEMHNFRNFIRSTGGGEFPTAQKKNSLKIAGDYSAGDMGYVTEKGFFLDGSGNAYKQAGETFDDVGEYNPDVHGLPVPMVKQKQRSKLQIA